MYHLCWARVEKVINPNWITGETEAGMGTSLWFPIIFYFDIKNWLRGGLWIFFFAFFGVGNTWKYINIFALPVAAR